MQVHKPGIGKQGMYGNSETLGSKRNNKTDLSIMRRRESENTIVLAGNNMQIAVEKLGGSHC
jgi:hypothetical protein